MNKKKVCKSLLLCTYISPTRDTPRGLRWRNFTNILSQKGWKMDILTMNSSMDHANHYANQFHLFSQEVRILKTYPGFLHNFAYNNLRRKEILEHIPYTKVEWVPLAFFKGLKLLKKNKYDLLISVSFPFVSHILCYFLKKVSGLPWIADYGDPWVYNPVSSWHGLDAKMRKKLEETILRQVDQIIVTTEETKELYLSKCPFVCRKDITVITQGYSKDEFNEVSPEIPNKFRIVYTGVFYKDIRNPLLFFESLKKINVSSNQLEIIVAGAVKKEYRNFVQEIGVSSLVRFVGHISHLRIISLQKGASVLLLFGNRGGCQLPGKIFEYIAAKRPILVIKYDEEDIAARIVEQLHRGVVVRSNSEQIVKVILDLYGLWKTGKIEEVFSLETVPSNHSWTSLGAKLEKLMLSVARQE